MIGTLPHLLASRYLLTERLASGGYGTTYRATDRDRADRQVVLKIPHEDYACEPGFSARFEAEARFQLASSHPNVVAAFDFGHDGQDYFIVMEWVDGPTLAALIREYAPLTFPEAMAIVRDVLQGLATIHARGMIHRDLKPANILLPRFGPAKIADFGLARIVASSASRDSHIRGTAAYLAPEQALGEALGPQADLYAVGVILFELLTGHLPFSGSPALVLLYAKVHEAPPSPRSRNPAISRATERIILRALARDPMSRYPTAEAMARELLAAAAEEPTERLEPIVPDEQSRELAAAAAPTPMRLPLVAPTDRSPHPVYVPSAEPMGQHPVDSERSQRAIPSRPVPTPRRQDTNITRTNLWPLALTATTAAIFLVMTGLFFAAIGGLIPGAWFPTPTAPIVARQPVPTATPVPPTMTPVPTTATPMTAAPPVMPIATITLPPPTVVILPSPAIHGAVALVLPVVAPADLGKNGPGRVPQTAEEAAHLLRADPAYLAPLHSGEMIVGWVLGSEATQNRRLRLRADQVPAGICVDFDPGASTLSGVEAASADLAPGWRRVLLGSEGTFVGLKASFYWTPCQMRR